VTDNIIIIKSGLFVSKIAYSVTRKHLNSEYNKSSQAQKGLMAAGQYMR